MKMSKSSILNKQSSLLPICPLKLKTHFLRTNNPNLYFIANEERTRNISNLLENFS